VDSGTVEDLYDNPEELQRRATTPEAINAMKYVQKSLDDALVKRLK
jgi:hypothetical protein